MGRTETVAIVMASPTSLDGSHCRRGQIHKSPLPDRVPGSDRGGIAKARSFCGATPAGALLGPCQRLGMGNINTMILMETDLETTASLGDERADARMIRVTTTTPPEEFVGAVASQDPPGV